MKIFLISFLTTLLRSKINYKFLPPKMAKVAVEVRIKPNKNNVLEYNMNKITVGSKTFSFSRVHSRISQKDFFNLSILPYLNGFLKGENCSILAYGQTGSGKTYTMGISSGTEKGIIHFCFDTIFKQNYTILISFIEIYNESIYDLLSDQKNALNLRQNYDETSIVGLRELEIKSYEEAIYFLAEGSLKRTTKFTKMNSESSRSHAIFTLIIRFENDNKISENRLSFVDLAGSERLKRTECVGNAKKESININSGLLSLGNVINALYLNKPHIPFRDSKLTRVLQKCLVGRVLLIACVSGLQSDACETTNTLKYASRAALISLADKVKVENDKDKLVIQNLKKDISNLKDEVNRLRALTHKGAVTNDSRKDPCFVNLKNIVKLIRPEIDIRSLEISVLDQNSLRNMLWPDQSVKIEQNYSNFSLISDAKPVSIESSNSNLNKFKNKTSNYSIKENEEYEQQNPIQAVNESPFKKDKRNESFPLFNPINQVDNKSESNDTLMEENSRYINSKHDTKWPIQSTIGIDSNGEGDSDSDKTEYNFDTSLEIDKLTLENTIKNTQISPVPSKVSEGKRVKLVNFKSPADLKLVDTIYEVFAHSMVFFGSDFIIFTKDGKITLHKEDNMVVIAKEDVFGCVFLAENLFYSTRSLLKVLRMDKRLLPVYAYKEEITCLRVIDNLVITGHKDGYVNFLNLDKSVIVLNWKPHCVTVTDIIVEGNNIFACCAEGIIRVASLQNNGDLNLINEFNIYENGCAFQSLFKFEHYFFAFGNKFAVYWNNEVLNSLKLSNCKACIYEDILIAGNSEGLVKIYDKNIVLLNSFDLKSGISAITTDGKCVYIALQSGLIYNYKVVK